MPRTIDYYFSMVSPWAYIGHAPFMEIVRRHGVEVNYKPVFLGRVFAETGGLPLAQRHPARQRYRLIELQRWREKRGLSFNIKPKHWPFDVNLADRFVIAVTVSGKDPDPFLRRAFAAVWEEERDLADPLVLAELAEAAGLDSTALMDVATGSTTEAIYALNLENAVAGDVFGSPAYVLDGEVFWGQDRLELLEDALASGRAPYSAAV
ncbi:2-hydroxychromene-2-carboxylate isomerase [Microvirga thermotolerans]|uniref:2-hydroxychromene-2-carboxylate isomerase n=1 Tax=Microvirga thermotolerans TaxID=2651334 RepID=A0A5P9JS13_9HYPH|nr:2-hydroxychromene-2-carboxylate isomerase [Microvirga thermotolerans]QFU15562.1 2-hydroxychromene-2-carboxylate isomerase [Microvirga thermotolerans]